MTAAADQDFDTLEKVLQIVRKHLEGTAIESGKVLELVADLGKALATPPATKAPPAKRAKAEPSPEPAETEEPFRWPKRLGPSIPGLRDDEPAVPIDQSVHPKYIICLEDGRPFKMMRRWLRTEYGLTPDQYRARWGLRPDYPMIASEVRKAKAAIAAEQDFGQVRTRLKASRRKPKA